MYRPTVALLVRLRDDRYGADRLGNAVAAWGDPVEVPGCLWAPGAPADLAGRPDGASVSATAHFPAGWDGDLRGALVSADGGATWLRAVGEPQPLPEAARRGPWATYALLGRADG